MKSIARLIIGGISLLLGWLWVRAIGVFILLVVGGQGLLDFVLANDTAGQQIMLFTVLGLCGTVIIIGVVRLSWIVGKELLP